MQPKCPHCGKPLPRDAGRSKGGRRSRRAITPEQQAKMQATRKHSRAEHIVLDLDHP